VKNLNAKAMKYPYLFFAILLIPVFISARQFPEGSDTMKPFHPDELRNGKYLVDSTYFYFWDEDQNYWDNFERSHITSRDQFGNIKKVVVKGVRPDNQQWYDKQRFDAIYYDSVVLQLWTGELWDAKAETWRMSDSIYNNTGGKPVITWFKEWDESKFRFSRGKKVYYHYGETELLESEMVETFDTISGGWKNDHRIEYTYSEDGLLHQKTTKLWHDDGSFTDSLRITNHYDGAQQPQEVIHELWSENRNWQNSKKTEYTYSPSGKPEQVYEYAWLANQRAWDKRYFWRYSYNEAGQLEEVVQQYWEDYYNDWLFLTRTTHQYNAQGSRTESLQEFYDAFSFYWYNVSRLTNSYDENGNRLVYTFQLWDEDSEQWINYYKDENWWSFFEPSSVFEAIAKKFSIFPNPANDFILINTEALFSPYNLKIFNSFGVPVLDLSLSAQNEKVDISNLPAGTYIIQLETDNQSEMKKLLVF
jgi:hypothetical protein